MKSGKKIMEVIRKHKVVTGLAVLLVLSILTFVLIGKGGLDEQPKLYFKDAELKRGKEVEIDVKLSNLKGEYPAASFEIVFDKNKMEFLEIRQGSMEIVNKNSGEIDIPEWQFSVEAANRNGSISTMFLDMTAGDNPLMQAKDKASDVLFRLVFRVKDSCSKGEKLQLTFKQATFAALDEKDSLAIYKNNIKIKRGSFKVN